MTDNAPDFELRSRTGQVRRIDRRKLILLVQGLACALVLLIAFSFWREDPAAIPQDTAPVIRRQTRPEGLERLPASYADLAARNKPGGPDTGKALYRSHPDTGDTNATDRQNREAAESGLFFKVRTSSTASTGIGAGIASEKGFETTGRLSERLTALSQGLEARSRTAGLPLQSQDQGAQVRRLAFPDQQPSSRTLNSQALQKASSPWTLMAGTVIAASLLTGLNSDLPGQVIAQVSTPVYDTKTGRHILIPQGTRILGRYDARVSHGQQRALVIWTRLILPDGSSVAIDNLPGTDLAGYSGLKDRVDHHTWSLVKGVALATILGVGTELTTGSNESDLVRAVRQSVQGSVEKAGDKIISKNLDVQPTITIRPGWPLRILVARDIIMTPYRDSPAGYREAGQ